MNPIQATVTQINPFQHKDDKENGVKVAKVFAIYLAGNNI